MPKMKGAARREKELTLDQFGALSLDDRRDKFLPYLGPTSNNILQSLNNEAFHLCLDWAKCSKIDRFWNEQRLVRIEIEGGLSGAASRNHSRSKRPTNRWLC
jgi:hypothetical protein